MEASTRAAIVEVRERLEQLTRRSAHPATGPELLSIADELFAVSRVLDGQLTLRRAMADPAGKPEERAGLVRRLFASQLSPTALDLVETIARQRWSRPIDLVEATVTVATEAALDAADVNGELDGVEDELFRFGRIVAGDRELNRILSDRKAPVEGRAALLDRLLSGRVNAVTEQLLRNVLTGSHAGTAEIAIERLSEVASRRRGQSVARVTTAVALTPAQEQQLGDVLGRLYGRPVGLQVTVDPDVLGGLVVQVGDEVIDGSIAHRLEAARRRLAG
ncbi:F0F1 ATP synthase subunit delta [Blastococcus sp. TML/M2B]|uniref:F0F1 ATP synthase subunit delta n=1 Tax=unclassified Blastococcus TaxID=2619396 RepID=UPI00190A04DA|nr:MULTISPECIES: F0F1 ATP synthase subunit delta [unclassified Blastococcus]MBN1093671.1 F0F1 ATP synthase subunit delta [Blastococcus sp. TML/M2B]MBN1096210.1 F0F1 ATP synthase subunit delta [Blastococcus sp. TML/C7B]